MEINQHLIIPSIAFGLGLLVGLILGWFIHKFISKKEIKNWERAFITVVVTCAWLMSVVFDIVISSYSTPIAVHAVMGLVAGYFFEGSIVDALRK